jgi:uncharacterized membrane protein YesL
MFDVQVLAHRRSPEVPEPVTESIAAYYRRVTTTASPMGSLVGLVMGVLLVALVIQAATGGAAVWVSAVSVHAAGAAIALAMVRVFPRAVRLGARTPPQTQQGELARRIFRDHVFCLVAMVTLLSVQLAAA